MQTKPPTKVDKTFDGIEKIAKGCAWAFVNLFVLVFLCWSLYLSFVGFRVEMNGAITTGHVSNLKLRDGGTYKAVVTFEVNGQPYSFDDDTAAYPPKYELGENVQVRYDVSNPNIAHIDSVFPVWLFPSCTLAVLIVAFIFINIYNWRAWKRGKDTIGF